MRKSEPRYRRDFQPEEVQSIFEAETNPDWRLRWLVYFHTGLRLRAGADICWEWIEWPTRSLRLLLEHNKSRRILEIPLSGALFDALAARRAELGGNPVGRIFWYIRGESIRRRLTKMCKKAGVDPKGICVHSIRHTVATLLYNNSGGNIKAVQEVLGHSNAGTTMRYLHITEDEKRRVIDSLGLGFQDDDIDDDDDEPEVAVVM